MYYTCSRGGGVLSLTTRIVIRGMLISAPFILAGAGVVGTLLMEADINFYLSKRPPLFWITILLLGLLTTGLLGSLMAMFVRRVYALPLLLFEGMKPAQALRASVERTEGQRLILAGWLTGWGIVSLVATTLATTVLNLTGRFLTTIAVGSLPWLFLILAVLLITFVLVQLAVGLLQAIAFSQVVVHLYARYGKGLGKQEVGSGPWAIATNQAPKGISSWWLGWGTVVAFLIAFGATGYLLHEATLQDRTEITAHRGASKAAPENTLASVRQAISDGAHWVEIDVQRTRDDEVVVIHDRDLKRVGGINLPIATTSYHELSAVDVGSWFKPEFKNERVPTLSQVLTLCKGQIKVNIELKYYGEDRRLAHRVIEIIERHGMVNEVVLMSLKEDAVRQLKTLKPGWSVGRLTAVAIGDITRVEADFLAVNANLVDRRFVRRTHATGKEVHAWTVNDVIGMTALMSQGVANIITDDPALGIKVLWHRAQLSPAERLIVKLGLLVGVAPQYTNTQEG